MGMFTPDGYGGFGTGGDFSNYEPATECIKCGNKELHISKKGNKMDVCSKHLSWFMNDYLFKEKGIWYGSEDELKLKIMIEQPGKTVIFSNEDGFDLVDNPGDLGVWLNAIDKTGTGQIWEHHYKMLKGTKTFKIVDIKKEEK